LKESIDDREKLNVNFTQVIPTKENLGVVLKSRKDNGPEDEINRLDPTLVSDQLQNNPFVINVGKKL
jgi:hypothetical protein